MRLTSRKATFLGLATIAVSTMVLAGCAAAPEDTTDGSSDGASDFLPCEVSDDGGFDDHSFNESALKGLTDAAKEIGSEEKHVESGSEDDYAPNIEGLLGEGCDLIVTVGFKLSAATIEAANANSDVEFAIIDDALDNTGATNDDGDPIGDKINDVTGGNGKPILFDTAQAAFLAGYAAASYSKTGVVGTFGGVPIPPVTIFMDGFVDGVAYYNEEKGTDVKAIGWDKEGQTGTFTGGFAPGPDATNAATGLLDQGADVLMPVGGAIYVSAATAIIDRADPTIALIGVDADVYNTDPDPAVKALLLTSVLKGVDAGVHDVVVAASKGDFDNTPYVGTLENGGLGLAPFHDFESKVSPDLQGELDALKQAIIVGDVEVTSPSTPK